MGYRIKPKQLVGLACVARPLGRYTLGRYNALTVSCLPVKWFIGYFYLLIVGANGLGTDY